MIEPVMTIFKEPCWRRNEIRNEMKWITFGFVLWRGANVILQAQQICHETVGGAERAFIRLVMKTLTIYMTTKLVN